MNSATSPFSPLRTPLFRAVWLTSLVSNFGGMVQSVGAAWMMTELGASAQGIALVQASTSLPIMLLALWAGALADNFDRRRIMLGAQTFMLAVSALLAAGAWAGAISPWILLLATFLVGCGTAINAPAWQASVRDMVPPSSLPGAVALNSMSFNVARSLGPAIGGAIVAAAGAAVTFLANALSYLGFIVVLWRWHPAEHRRTLPRERLGRAMLAGIRYLRLSPHLRVVILRSALFGTGATAMPALMPLVARDAFGGGSVTYGILLGAFGIGAVGGGLVSVWLRGRLSAERIVEIASVALGVGAALLATTTWLPLAFLALMPAGTGLVLGFSTFNVSVQLGSPRWVVARTLALYQMALFGGMTGGSWVYGWWSAHHGVRSALLLAAGASLLCTLARYGLSIPTISQDDLTPADDRCTPSAAVPLEGRDGPIAISVERRIAPSDAPAFLHLMEGRRRAMRRNGAHGWTLVNSLSEPTLWVERYRFATWLAYARSEGRTTRADEVADEAIAQLQPPGTSAVFQRWLERQTTASSELPLLHIGQEHA